MVASLVPEAGLMVARLPTGRASNLSRRWGRSGKGRGCGGRGRGLSTQELTASQSSVQGFQHGQGARQPVWRESGQQQGHPVPRGLQACPPSPQALPSLATLSL